MRQPRQRQTDLHLQSLAAPMMRQGAGEAVLDHVAQQLAAEARRRRRRRDPGTAALDPVEVEPVLLLLPADIDLALLALQGAVFEGVGRQFMEDQGDAGKPVAAAEMLGPLEGEAAGGAGRQALM